MNPKLLASSILLLAVLGAQDAQAGGANSLCDPSKPPGKPGALEIQARLTKDAAFRGAFRRFNATMYTEELVDYLLDEAKFRARPDLANYKALYDKYLDLNSKSPDATPINLADDGLTDGCLPSRLREQNKKLLANQLKPGAPEVLRDLDLAAFEAEKLLNSSSVPLFKEGPEEKSVLEKVKEYLRTHARTKGKGISSADAPGLKRTTGMSQIPVAPDCAVPSVKLARSAALADLAKNKRAAAAFAALLKAHKDLDNPQYLALAEAFEKAPSQKAWDALAPYLDPKGTKAVNLGGTTGGDTGSKCIYGWLANYSYRLKSGELKPAAPELLGFVGLTYSQVRNMLEAKLQEWQATDAGAKLYPAKKK